MEWVREDQMGRPRAFDQSAAVGAAMDRFWRHGYEATSVRDLASAMSMTGASLYNAFGDKRRLFRHCLDTYLDTYARRRIAELDASDDPISGIRTFFDDLVAASLKDRRGCLLVNSAMEVAPWDPEFAELIEASLREIEDGFHRALERLPAERHRQPYQDTRTTARLILSAVISLRVLARAGGDRDRLCSIARSAVALAEGVRAT
ncbi:TetR/AcrR family transcriptional regulator [Mesorhizobium sp. M00.F.Ca.ET.216.01.1.1]|uniref:TetR/AcrR family transcriptional regulator n=1 Tax=unclassified Mesorhizobium TaxID=325217 RepID=UPI000FD92BFD|nr:TetR/AcrR family transcriptional regulator [Mesorhizobium sp. M00.F.Ca.ET.216.01.1.1]TIS89363.1 MAG: TetR/AcrR family transcriptional regulator [Mesorhizobium sp.]TJW11822.1 MAG: TetR/AcrR family transcriptional regulator [Mesorhizobium sp.]TJW47365.1 MAG: TetR/AcrR family transcriptional regulator [Mesorhizobium sp.]